MKESREGTAGKIYWTVQAMNARGQVTSALMGNGTQITASHDAATGAVVQLLDATGTAMAQDLLLDWDAMGNLLSRRDWSGSRNQEEQFFYDVRNRLTRTDSRTNGGTWVGNRNQEELVKWIAMNALELKVPPVALVVIAAAGMWGVSQLSTDLNFSIPRTTWLAAGIAMAGIFVSVLGVMEFRRAETTVDPRVPEKSANLVISGVYRHSRNPMYAGFVLVLFGWAVFLGSVLSLLFIPAFVVYMNRFQIIPEERFMRSNFGDSFAQYSSSVRRWI